MTADTMREAMDHLRTDTDDLTGATSPTPTDEELTTAVALLAGQLPPTSPRRPPGWWVIALLAAFILLADVGILLALSAQRRVSVAACERVNGLRAAETRRVTAQEASVPAERYDVATRDYYDAALADLRLTNCEHPVAAQPAVLPKRMSREPGQPPPAAVPGSGATGETGAAGVPGLVGADGKDGAVGATGASGSDGKDGAVGAPGAVGADGRAGADGAPGLPGADSQVPGPPGPPAPTTTTTLPPPLLCLLPPCP